MPEFGEDWTTATDDRTVCCGATITFHDTTLCCRACYREVAELDGAVLAGWS